MTKRSASADYVTGFATGWPENQPDLMVLSLTTSTSDMRKRPTEPEASIAWSAQRLLSFRVMGDHPEEDRPELRAQSRRGRSADGRPSSRFR